MLITLRLRTPRQGVSSTTFQQHSYADISTMSDAQKQLQEFSDNYQKLQTGPYASTYCHSLFPMSKRLIGFVMLELEAVVAAREKLESQQQENKTVQKVYDSEYLSWSLHMAHGFETG